LVTELLLVYLSVGPVVVLFEPYRNVLCLVDDGILGLRFGDSPDPLSSQQLPLRIYIQRVTRLIDHNCLQIQIYDFLLVPGDSSGQHIGLEAAMVNEDHLALAVLGVVNEVVES
jgi:hypothetical protein